MKGSVVDNIAVPMPDEIEICGEKVKTNDDALIESAGYSDLVFTPKPVTNGDYYTDTWIYENGKWVQHWSRHPEVTQ